MPTNKEIIFAFITITIVFVVLATIIGLVVSLYKKKVIGLEIEKKARELEFKNTLTQSQLEIQEETLNTISKEIHDNIGQSLSYVNLLLNTIETTDDNILNKTEESVSLIDSAIQNLRDISKSLDSETFKEIGLKGVIEQEVKRINKSNINASFIVEGKVEKLKPQIELILFRMLQECINNTIKHSKATTIDINAYYGKSNLEIIIEDNGIGFDENKIVRGQGLNNLHSRSKFLNARIELQSIINKGTTVCIDVPYNY